MSSNPWGPNEPASVVHGEEAWLQGLVLLSVAYGALLVLFIQCFALLLKQTKRSNYRTKVPFLIIVFLIFLFGTMFTGATSKFTQLAFIEDRNFPGGPNAFMNEMFAIPVDALANVSFVLSQWLCDGLIIWRYMMIYRGCSVPMWILMIFPVLLFLASFVVSVLYLIQLSVASPFVVTAINWTIPYFAISLAINILASLAIVSRLLLFRHRIASVLGPSHGSQYTSIAAMIIESASLFSVWSITFIVPFALNNPVSTIFFESMGLVQACSTLLIIYRAASGKAWSSSTQQTLISMQCAPNNNNSSSRARGGIEMMKMGHSTPNAGSGTVVRSHTNASLAGSEFKNGSSVLAVNGVTIIKDFETDMDTHSLGADSSRDESNRV